VARQSGAALKAKKQVSEYTSQKMYAGMQQPFLLYNVLHKKDGTVVAANVTIKQFVREFVPITHFTLEPVK
jgi:hypothetical protein